MSAQRAFSDKELERAGRTSDDLIQEATLQNEWSTALELAARLHEETRNMLYGYLQWPKKIQCFMQARDEIDVFESWASSAMAWLPAELPKASDVFASWEGRKTALDTAIKSGNAGKSEKISRNWRIDALEVHDCYMTYAALLMSQLARHGGDAAVTEVYTRIMDPEAMDMRPQSPFRQRVETLIRFTRLHLLPFRVFEDDEKATFIASPCPSGGRLIQKGIYRKDGPGVVIRGPSPLTYAHEQLPVYCCHEPVMEAQSIRQFGAPLFVVDPSADLRKSPCHVHVYKEAEQVPLRYYKRLGLERDSRVIARA